MNRSRSSNRPSRWKAPEDVVRVAKPAVPVVPGPSAARGLGDRGGGGGHDGARVLEAVELERERRTDHLVLEEHGHRAALHPASPVADRLVEESVGEGLERLLDGLPPRQCEVPPARQGEGLAGGHVGERDVGGEPQGCVEAGEAEVVRSLEHLRALAAPAQPRIAGHPDARLPAQGLEHAEELGGPEGALVLLEAGCEVDETERIDSIVEQRLEHVGVREVALDSRSARGRTDLEAAAPSSSSSEPKIGSESKRGRQHQTTAPSRCTRAAYWQLPMIPRSSRRIFVPSRIVKPSPRDRHKG